MPPAPPFWGPVTSTIDWCEANYATHAMVAEFWNSSSSLAIAAAGAVNALRCFRAGAEPRFILLSLTIVLVGLGSAAFHGMLTYESQMLDELPMLYSMAVWLYSWCEAGQRTVQRAWLAPALLLAAGGVTVLHVSYGFVLVFQLTFALMVTVGFGFVLRHHRSQHADPTSRRLCAVYAGFTVLAVGPWLADQHYCQALSAAPFNPQLHAWWHCLVGISCWNCVPLALWVRAPAIGCKPRMVSNCGGVLPHVTLERAAD